jgi:hypothetical protein
MTFTSVCTYDPSTFVSLFISFSFVCYYIVPIPREELGGNLRVPSWVNGSVICRSLEASLAWLVSCFICLWNARNHMRADENGRIPDLLVCFCVFVPRSLIGIVHFWGMMGKKDSARGQVCSFVLGNRRAI